MNEDNFKKAQENIEKREFQYDALDLNHPPSADNVTAFKLHTENLFDLRDNEIYLNEKHKNENGEI